MNTPFEKPLAPIISLAKNRVAGGGEGDSNFVPNMIGFVLPNHNDFEFEEGLYPQALTHDITVALTYFPPGVRAQG